MARRKPPESTPDPRPVSTGAVRRALSFAGWTAGLLAVVFGFAFALLQGEHFLSADSRFHLAEPDYRTDEDPAITVRGLNHASRAEVLKVFRNDRGRSLVDVNTAQRRIALRRVEWVRDAGVRRIWPNRLAIDIDERRPVAIVQVAASLSGDFANPVNYRPMLVDADGFLLRLNGPIPADLPLLLGIRQGEDVELRRRRVTRMQQVLTALRSSRPHIQEVDVSDPDNVRIAYQIQDRQVILILGGEDFEQRLDVFLRHFDGIRDRLPPRAVLDVSMKNRINAVTPLLEARK